MRLFKRILSVWDILKGIPLTNWICIGTIVLMISELVWVFYYAGLSFWTFILSIVLACIFGGMAIGVGIILGTNPYLKRRW